MKEINVQTIRNKYLPGTRVECIRMTDPQPVPPGTKGTVILVDDVGSIHVRWETGSGLALIPGEDEFRVLQED